MTSRIQIRPALKQRDGDDRIRQLRRTVLLAATFLGVPFTAAQAQGAPPLTQGPYVSLGGGYNLSQVVFGHPRTTPDRPDAGRYRFKNGYVGSGSVGWGFGNGIRVEIEGTYSASNINNYAGTRVPSRTFGNVQNYGLFGNVFYDIDLPRFGLNVTAVRPYVGVGVGVLWTRLGLQSNFADRTVFRNGGTASNFDYQGIVGFSAPIGAVPGLALTTDYRFIGVATNSGSAGQYFANGRLSKGTVDLSPAFSHQFTVGLSYAFNHPQSPPPPAQAASASTPAPQSARTYLVFFDWDRADLTDRARQIIAEAAQATTRTQVTRVEVAGHADRSGTPAYNQGLSQRRAQSVASELMRLGVTREAITILAFGESRPLVSTADGVREPQNRRVEIILR